MPNPLAFGVGVAEPRDAATAFQQRKQLLPSYAWQDVFGQEHSRGRAVAGIMRLDVLQTIFDEIDTTLKEGRSLKDFAERLVPRLQEAGFWGDVQVKDPGTGDTRTTRFDMARLQLIMDVNLRQSHGAGRWQRAQRTKDRFPLLVYETMHDDRVRDQHRQWDHLVLPIDDPWVRSHWTPNGWRCRCRWRSIDDQGVQALRDQGKPVKTDPPPVDWRPYVNPRTGEVVPVPAGVDPGFGHIPGQAVDQAFWNDALRKAAAAHPMAGAVAVAQMTADRAAFVAEATAAFSDWVDGVVAAGQARGDLRFVGALRPAAVRALADAHVHPASAAVAVRDADVLHTLRDAKAASGAAIDAQTYRQLPQLLERARAVLLDTSTGAPAALYVVDMPGLDGKVTKLVVRLDMPIKTVLEGRRVPKVPVNVVRTVTVIGDALRDPNLRLIWGAL